MSKIDMSEDVKTTYYLVAVFIIILIGVIGVLYYMNINRASRNQTSGNKLNVSSEEIPFSPQAIKANKWVIDTRIEGDNIICEITIYYNDTVFKSILDNWTEYKSSLEANISNFKEPGTSIGSLQINYLENSSSIHVYFKVYGAVTSYNGECRATFIWLLKPLGLDFIGSGFQEYNDRLTWSGKIRGVEYSITILLPKQNATYAAWGDRVGHCHGHVWWPCTSS